MAIWVDGLIIILYFIAITAIGLYMGRREKTLHDFALGGRNMPWWAVMASIIAAETSAATFLGTPGEGFTTQTLWYVQLIIGLILGRIIVGYVFLKPYYRYKVYTVYDYLGIRFGPISRNYISALFLFMRTLASGTRMFVPSLVMVLAWQLYSSGGREVGYRPVESLAPYLVAIILITLLTCVYTAVGGIKAVIWTDLIQAVLMFGGAILAIVTLLYHIGGDSANLLNGLHKVGEAAPKLTTLGGYFQTGFETDVVQKYQATNKLDSMSSWNYVQMILANPYTLFSATIGSMFLNMAAFGTDQDMVQRMLTAQTYQKSRRSLITAALMDLPIAAAFTFIGVLLFVYYGAHPAYLPKDAAGNVVAKDVFGSYILNVLPMGVRGLVMAGVFATAMGSLSTALNALATSATNDWYIPYFARRRDEAHHVAAARVFTAIFALLMIAIAGIFAWASIRDPSVRIIPVVLGIAGFILGPMLGVFLLGMLTRQRGSDRGNLIAISAGLVSTIVLGDLHIDAANLISSALGGGRLSSFGILPSVSFTWYAVVGAVVVMGIGVFFPTPPATLEQAERRAAQAAGGDDRPVAMRDDARGGAAGLTPSPVLGRGRG